MLCSDQSGITSRNRLPLAFWLGLAATLLSYQAGYAETPKDGSLPNLPTLPIEWTSGPADVRLGSVANFSVPADYKFTDAKGARIELQQMKVPAGKGILGLLEPKSGGWYVLIEFAEVGYIKDADKQALNAETILSKTWERVQARNGERTKAGAAPVMMLDWQQKPAYEASRHSLEWALVADTGTDRLLSHTLRMLGCHGALDMTLVCSSSKAGDVAPIKDLAKAISFREGERYANFETGDKVANVGLGELVFNDNSSQEAAAPAPSEKGSSKKKAITWIAGVALFALAAGGILVLKRGNRRKHNHEESREHSQTEVAATPPPAPPAATPSAEVVRPEARAMNVPAFKPKPKLSQVALNKSSFARPENNHNHQNGSRRKKMFDYNRYFTDLMSAVSSQGSQGEVFLTNGHSSENGRLPNGAEFVEEFSAASPKPANPNSEMIANQRTLIEEQKRLIQEQNKLIEEKSKLIAEKNQLLKMQSELIDSKLL